ncbi:hypothetical protein N665_0742s0013 [Sinapis alba]|nr:hypothetical protein N665_0742s0013 [Sinapis alba]
MRGGLGSVNQLSVTIGIMLAYLLGLFVPWRILAVLGKRPETIFYYYHDAKMGMTDDFETSLQVLRGFETDITVKRSVASSTKRSSTVRFVDLKRRRYYFPHGVTSSNAATFGVGAIQILPVNIKGLAGSIATLANWFFSWVITMTANLLLAWSSGGTFTLYGVVCAFTVVFVTLWVPETKGKTLEELQALFR